MQKLREDKIGQLTHSAGNITMAASLASPAYLTIGGRQFVVTSNLVVALPTLAANNRYQVFAVVSGGLPVLVISQNENSVGPAGFTSWKLVGSFYANGLVSVGFGSFLTLEGVPTTDWMSFTPISSWTSNTTHFGQLKRVGDNMEMQIYSLATGAPGPGVLSYITPHVIDLVKRLVTLPLGLAVSNYGPATTGVVAVTSSTSIQPQRTTAGLSYDTITPTTPTTFANGNSVSTTVVLPIVGWNNTPIKDL